MELLIDYDNLLEKHKKPGLALLLERILARVHSAGTTISSRVHTRLYGGWYDGLNLSRRAQALAADLHRNFPLLFRRPTTQPPVFVSAELALTLALDRTTHFHHTFRRQSSSPGVRCRDPRSLGCVESSCPAAATHQMLRTGSCPQPDCNWTTRDLLYRASQKLVDTMLTADLIGLASQSSEPVVVVSSDDDMWPGLHSVLLAGTAAVQVHTKPNAIKRHPYARPGQAGYSAVELA